MLRSNMENCPKQAKNSDEFIQSSGHVFPENVIYLHNNILFIITGVAPITQLRTCVVK